MVHANPDDIQALEKLAAELEARGFATALVAPQAGGPRWKVRNPPASMLAETVMYARGWYWWPWADRIAPAADVADAAARVASVLRVAGSER